MRLYYLCEPIPDITNNRNRRINRNIFIATINIIPIGFHPIL